MREFMTHHVHSCRFVVSYNSKYQMSEITAKVRLPRERISQCDIFKDIEVIENITLNGTEMELKTITFPYVICLNQDCDLLSDVRDKKNQPATNKNCRLLHLIVAPVFNFASFVEGTHWGDLFDPSNQIKVARTEGRKIMSNEDPRYHFLHFDDKSELPDMVIDFKHFFTVSTEMMYENLSHRVCAIEEVYREKICQRFAFFQSRIGLPD